VLQAVLGGAGAALAFLGKRFIGMGAGDLGGGHFRHWLASLLPRGISLEAIALVSPAGGGHGSPAACHASKAVLMLALVG
jgi:hypothetical protein